MSAQIETVFDQLSNVGNQKNSQARGSNSPSDGTVFSDLLRDQATNNITFFNPGSQLSIPEGAQTEEFDFANNETSHIDNDTAAETDDAVDDGQYAEDDQSDQEEVATTDKQGAADDAAPTVTGMNAAVIDPNAAAKTDTTSNQATQAQGQAAQAVSADKTGAQNAQQSGQQQTKNADGIHVNSTTNETVDIDPAKLNQKQSNTNASGMNVTISDRQSTVTGQQNSTLAAASTVAAQTTKTAEVGGEKSTVADMLLETAEEAALNGSNSANKAKPAGSDSQANSGNGNQAGQNLPNGQPTPQEAQPAPTAATPQFNPTVASVANAGSAATAAAPSAAAGSTGQVASVDSATGAAVLDGQNGQTVKNSASTQAAANNNRPNVPPQLVSDQVSVNIQRAAGQGQDQIKIQLRPYELGRIEVTMEMAKDGKMTAVITAEKQETLDMLKSDSNNLVKSLNDAGMQTDSSSLSFNLGNQGNGYNQFADGNGANNGSDSNFSLEGDEAAEEEANTNTMLGLGEEAQPNADGSYDIQV
ncbi:flagellar hook-length control protein FliK [Curvivirga aplysinae]|uniref:flagellar hook-length control protein FliK n=1 Tax=Curvivirga aplysinae TaxID=2529852 RepID=UPI0012BCEF3F|nr:flagellar hook-length control protein FliK [Curvivirga aplysinae]MTI10563.1 flagellar hook-length control protein FliK [Curvivirga aplysinae]